MNRINTNQLTHEGNYFTGDISDLGPNFRLQQVYADACDVGFVLVSARTGKELTMVQCDTISDSDGEVKGWGFEPTRKSIRQIGQHVAHLRVILYND